MLDTWICCCNFAILQFKEWVQPFVTSNHVIWERTRSKMAVSRVSRIDIPSRFQFGFEFMESCRIQFSFIHGYHCAYDSNAYTWYCSGLIFMAIIWVINMTQDWPWKIRKKFTAVLSQNNLMLQKRFLCSLIQYFISFMTLFPAFYTIISRVRGAARQDEESRSDISGYVQ